MRKIDEKTVITDFSLDDLASEMMRDCIGSDFLINDNLDINFDFESELTERAYNRTSKKTGFWTLFFCVEGEVEVESNTQHYVMHAGDAQYCSSGHIGKMTHMSPDTRFFLIACSDNFYIPPTTATESAAFRRELVIHPIAHLDSGLSKAVMHLYTFIRNSLAKRDQYHYVRRTVQGFVQSIFFLVLSAYGKGAEADSASPYTNARHEEIFGRFMKLVEKNYTQERNIGFYADKLCITPKYLSQLVFKASGIYAGDHIDNYVIAEAKVLIKSHKHTIAQISDMLNFTSQAYFGRYFKKHTGMTPMEFADKG